MDAQDFYTPFVFAPRRRPLEHEVYHVPPWSTLQFEVLRIDARVSPYSRSGRSLYAAG